MLKYIPVFVMLGSTLVGCATEEKYDEIVNSWVGSRADDLVLAWGPPTSSYEFSTGGSVLEYEESEQIQMGGYSYSAPQNTYTSDGLYTQMTTTYTTVTTPASTYDYVCVTRFTVDASNVITGVATEGNNCVAE